MKTRLEIVGKRINFMRANLLDIEIELEGMDCNLNIINSTMAYLEVQIKELEENEKVLKQDGIITTIKGFKITKEQIKLAKKKMTKLKNSKKRILREIKLKEENREHYMNELDRLLKARDDNRNNNVIEISDFIKRCKDGK